MQVFLGVGSSGNRCLYSKEGPTVVCHLLPAALRLISEIQLVALMSHSTALEKRGVEKSLLGEVKRAPGVQQGVEACIYRETITTLNLSSLMSVFCSLVCFFESIRFRRTVK